MAKKSWNNRDPFVWNDKGSKYVIPTSEKDAKKNNGKMAQLRQWLYSRVGEKGSSAFSNQNFISDAFNKIAQSYGLESLFRARFTDAKNEMINKANRVLTKYTNDSVNADKILNDLITIFNSYVNTSYNQSRLLKQHNAKKRRQLSSNIMKAKENAKVAADNAKLATDIANAALNAAGSTNADYINTHNSNVSQLLGEEKMLNAKTSGDNKTYVSPNQPIQDIAKSAETVAGFNQNKQNLR